MSKAHAMRTCILFPRFSSIFRSFVHFFFEHTNSKLWNTIKTCLHFCGGNFCFLVSGKLLSDWCGWYSWSCVHFVPLPKAIKLRAIKMHQIGELTPLMMVNVNSLVMPNLDLWFMWKFVLLLSALIPPQIYFCWIYRWLLDIVFFMLLSLLLLKWLFSPFLFHTVYSCVVTYVIQTVVEKRYENG